MFPQTYHHERNYGCRLREYVYRDHRCVALENEELRVVVVADKGTDLIEFLYKPLDLECLWQAPGGLRSPLHYRPSSPLAAGHFREHFAGGWYEMLPNGPAPCSHRGAEFGYHGEATLLPWGYQILMDEPEKIEVKFRVRLLRLPLLVEKTLSLTSQRATLHIHERITNEAGQEVEFLWGHHPTFGWPLVEEGARIYLPSCRAITGEVLPQNHRLAPMQQAVWPHIGGVDGATIDLSFIPGPAARAHDFVRLEEFSSGWFAIVNPHRQAGFGLRWDARVFPLLGYWQVFRGAMDYPWYGMNYLIALEPACELPSLSEAVRRGTAHRLAAGAQIETELEATIFRAPLTVTEIQRGGQVR
jgi:hypothetical protein